MLDSSTGGPDRRQFLRSVVAVTGATALAGCSTLWSQTGATDVVVRNVADERKVVSVTVRDTEVDEPHTSRTLEMDPHTVVDPVNRSKLPTNASYTVEVAVEGGPSETFEWADPQVELAPLHVLVDDSRNIKFLLQAG